MTDSSAFAALKTAAAGLLYPSETDAPFDISESPTPPRFEPPPGEAMQEITLDNFFEGLEDNPQFQKLHDIILQTLTEIRVFRVGNVEIHIHIVGKTPANSWITLSTLSVETG